MMAPLQEHAVAMPLKSLAVITAIAACLVAYEADADCAGAFQIPQNWRLIQSDGVLLTCNASITAVKGVTDATSRTSEFDYTGVCFTTVGARGIAHIAFVGTKGEVPQQFAMTVLWPRGPAVYTGHLDARISTVVQNGHADGATPSLIELPGSSAIHHLSFNTMPLICPFVPPYGYPMPPQG
jgi:hypothetical protein